MAAETYCFEIPGPERKADALAFIEEFRAYGSEINGTGGLDGYTENYDGWLRKLQADYTRVPDEERVPARTFFFVRESDGRIVGMCNIRLALNEALRQNGGHIGYGIRPTERGKGLGKLQLYLALRVCARHGIETALLDANLDNPASWRIMEALGGVRTREYFDELYDHCMAVGYEIAVKKALAEHTEYEAMISKRAAEL